MWWKDGGEMVPQSQNSTDSETTVKDYIALLSEWQKFYKNIIYMAILCLDRIFIRYSQILPNKLYFLS